MRILNNLRCIVICTIIFVITSSVESSNENILQESTTSKILKNDNASNSSMEVEDKLIKQIYEIIEHFKQDDPVGLPVVPLPDPTDVDDINQSISMTNLKMTKVKLYGISQFRIRYISTEIKDMEAKCGILFETLILKGEYSLSSFVSRSKGPFTINLKNVMIDGNASVGVERDGKLRTQHTNIDVTFSDMTMDFKNLGFLAAVFQSLANSASNVIFDGIKPFILKDAYVKIKVAIDENLEKLVGNAQIPNSISPIDNAIAEARKQVRAKGYDPFKVEDYNHPGVIGVKIFNTWLYGLSSFYRLGDLSLNIVKNNAIITIEIGTQEISGSTMWQVSIAKGVITRAGSLQFTVQHIKVRLEVSQSLNLSKKLQINDLQLDIGNIQIRSNGLGTVDYLVEFFINVVPNLLRYQITDALEKPLMKKIQEFTDQIDVEKFAKEKFNEYQKTGSLKLDLNVEL